MQADSKFAPKRRLVRTLRRLVETTMLALALCSPGTARAVRRAVETARRLPPELPHVVGMKRYQRVARWHLDASRCPCDVHFVEYLKESNTHDATLFHFGTGMHHIVGLENSAMARPSQIIGITAAAREHEAYVKLVVDNPELGKSYKVLFADIYALSENCLPSFDLVTLFHLCEFYMPERSAFVFHDDESLLTLFLNKLRPGGRILFFTESYCWKKTEMLVRACELAGKIRLTGVYKTLVIYSKLPAEIHDDT